MVCGIDSTAPRISPSIYAALHIVNTYIRTLQFIRMFIEFVARRGRNETVSFVRVSFCILFAGSFFIWLPCNRVLALASIRKNLSETPWRRFVINKNARSSLRPNITSNYSAAFMYEIQASEVLNKTKYTTLWMPCWWALRSSHILCLNLLQNVDASVLAPRPFSR